jgi:hypothetical protein
VSLHQSTHESYKAVRDYWRENPIPYFRDRLGIKPTWQQAEIIEAIAQPGAKVTVRSGHGLGKTTTLAGVVYWMLECQDNPRIPITAPSSSQLRDVLWPELAKCRSRSDRLSMARDPPWPKDLWIGQIFKLTQDKLYANGAPNEVFAVARTAKPESPDALQGFHASNLTISDDGYSIIEDSAGGELLFIVEEASGVADKVFEVAEGALSSPRSRLLMVGNPTTGTGYFANSHKKDRALYTALHYKSMDSPLVDKDYRSNLIRKFGEGSNVVRVRADGEFPLQDDDVLIPIDHTEASLKRPRYKEDDHLPCIMGVDVARYGDDRTTFVLRQGRNVLKIAVHSKESTMVTSGRCIVYAKEWGATFINIDEGGVGGGVVDRVEEVIKEKEIDNLFVQGVSAASKTTEDRTTFDGIDAQPFRLRDELWQNCQIWFRDEAPSLVEAPRDYAEDMAGELSTVKYKIDSSGRLVVESKDEMKRAPRNLRSPDLADALNLTFAKNVAGIWGRL